MMAMRDLYSPSSRGDSNKRDGSISGRVKAPNTDSINNIRDEIQALQREYDDLRKEGKHMEADQLQRKIDEKVRDEF
jgi:TolA-binding protein